MSFNTSAENIRVDEGHILRAALQNGNGDKNEVEIDLNSCLGNDNGRFYWGGNDFAASAQNINFTIEGDNIPVLRAQLTNGEGNPQDADVNLAERIGNNDGQFTFNQ